MTSSPFRSIQSDDNKAPPSLASPIPLPRLNSSSQPVDMPSAVSRSFPITSLSSVASNKPSSSCLEDPGACVAESADELNDRNTFVIKNGFVSIKNEADLFPLAMRHLVLVRSNKVDPFWHSSLFLSGVSIETDTVSMNQSPTGVDTSLAILDLDAFKSVSSSSELKIRFSVKILDPEFR
eukprot:CAMPEP_0175041132 /NCGR_PEP_ID=MMETSP0052_2-20121109/1735_1 /TAXON_ID=51329 ORGANISM="Polytomella parva, Strain SAG 63-3" /NCGR_SAMPLE_ID=MMETSP0052_2 /ASSEMBLY_ACC=CAM_ASM_000194 /LENGTH=179 /DNA_ID=CAMNT_0016303593 /DNA_START=227 /DNA_END=763 /DNA_ORIENTATION=+